MKRFLLVLHEIVEAKPGTAPSDVGHESLSYAMGQIAFVTSNFVLKNPQDCATKNLHFRSNCHWQYRFAREVSSAGRSIHVRYVIGARSLAGLIKRRRRLEQLSDLTASKRTTVATSP